MSFVDNFDDDESKKDHCFYRHGDNFISHAYTTGYALHYYHCLNIYESGYGILCISFIQRFIL